MSTPRVTSAIVLAGGLGTRLRSAVPDLPKPMAPIHGRPFLMHQLDHWIAQGIGHFILSVGYLHDRVIDGLGHHYRGAALDYVIERSPLGTGGALLLAGAGLPRDEPALLLNGDTYFDMSLGALDTHARRCQAQWCLALFGNSDPKRYMGVGIDADGYITSVRQPASPWANAGVYWFQPRTLDLFSDSGGQALSLENDLFPRLLQHGQRFAGLPCSGDFIDIGVPEDYRRAADLLPQQCPVGETHAHTT